MLDIGPHNAKVAIKVWLCKHRDKTDGIIDNFLNISKVVNTS